MTNNKTLSVILKESFDLFTNHSIQLIKTVVVVYLPLEIVIIFLLKSLTGQIVPGGGIVLSQVITSLMILILTIGASLLYQIAVVKMIESIDKKQQWQPLAAYEAAFAVLGSYVGVALWVMVKVVLWSLFFIIPGIIFGIFYSFSSMAFLLDGKKGIEALQFSRKLIQPHMGRFIGNSLVVGLIVSVIYFLIKIILSVIFGVPLDNNPSSSSLIGQGVGNVLNAIVGTYVFIFYYLLYQDFKKITVTV